MAVSKSTIKSTYPLPAYNYRVSVDGEGMSFSEVSGITLEQEVATYRHGFSFMEGEALTRFPSRKFIPISLRRGIVQGKQKIYDWLVERPAAFKTVLVSLCDETGTPVITWQMNEAIPTKLEAPTLDANSNEVAIETLEMMVAGISMQHH